MTYSIDARSNLELFTMKSPIRLWFSCLCLATCSISNADDPPGQRDRMSPLRQDNLVAWCIVPFDAAERGPTARAHMLQELGIRRCAYDWREKHVPTFEQEIIEYRKHGIEFFAFWGIHEDACRLFEKHDLHPQIWCVLGTPENGTDEEMVDQSVAEILQHAERTKLLGCKLGLYNHGGWQGEPDNLVAVCRKLRSLGHDHVGIVYNFHHGHDHIDDWAESFELMQPYLHCLNLNGMNDNAQPKILGISKGTHDREMIRVVIDSDYDGPIGILDHRLELDSLDSLRENMEGVHWLEREFKTPGSGGSKPVTPKPLAQKNAASGHSASRSN